MKRRIRDIGRGFAEERRPWRLEPRTSTRTARTASSYSAPRLAVSSPGRSCTRRFARGDGSVVSYAFKRADSWC